MNVNQQIAAATGKLLFTDEIQSINKEAELLKNRGVDILIALGHSGYSKDQEIARNCPHIDVVVGGHSHSLLWNGTRCLLRHQWETGRTNCWIESLKFIAGGVASTEEAHGPYPTMVRQQSGRNVPVVQAYAYGKYLGNLQVVFDDDGEVVAAFGQPIVLDQNVPQGEPIEAEWPHVLL